MILNQRSVHRCVTKSRENGKLQARCFHLGPSPASLPCQAPKCITSIPCLFKPAAALPRQHQSRQRTVPAAGHALPEYKLAEKPPARLAVFVSGGGSNMKALHAAIQDSRLNAEIAVRCTTSIDVGSVFTTYVTFFSFLWGRFLVQS